MTFNEWQKAYPNAAQALVKVLNGVPWSEPGAKGSEAAASDQARLSIAKQGGFAWRNNVGATPTKCTKCGTKLKCPGCGYVTPPVRYGLANDSVRLNQAIKSSDLIAGIPRVITPDMVGQTIAQLGGFEVKKPGWKYAGTEREQGQLKWLTLLNNIGGVGKFVTGAFKL